MYNNKRIAKKFIKKLSAFFLYKEKETLYSFDVYKDFFFRKIMGNFFFSFVCLKMTKCSSGIKKKGQKKDGPPLGLEASPDDHPLSKKERESFFFFKMSSFNRRHRLLTFFSFRILFFFFTKRFDTIIFKKHTLIFTRRRVDMYKNILNTILLC